MQNDSELKRESIRLIHELKQASMAVLKRHYIDLLGNPPPYRASREFLLGNIAWTIQVKHSGKDPKQIRKSLVALAGRQSPSPKTQYLPGTRLIREWQGVTHEVVIEEKGFRWQNQHYCSLSRIAREITGARWSGPRFFGLRQRSTEKSTAEQMDDSSSIPS